MEPLACSNQALSPDDSESDENGIQLHSRLASAVEHLPRLVKAESVKNQLRKSPHGVSEEEMEFTLPDSSLPKTGVIPREKVKSLIDQNGIKLQRKTMGGPSSEGSIAKAAREKYLVAEAAMQEARIRHQEISMGFKAGEHQHIPSVKNAWQAVQSTKGDRNTAYDEMNSTAGKPDELVQAERDYQSAVANFNVVMGCEVKTDPNPLSPKFRDADNRRQETKRILAKLQHKHESSSPRYEQYITPGGIPGSYQEHLLKIPVKQSGTVKGIYRSPHWPKDPNVVAHWRADDRAGATGEKVLHVHEVQSDLHQAGRDNGYRGKPVTDDEIRQTIRNTRGLRDNSVGKIENILKDPKERAYWTEVISDKQVPNFPFKNNEWANLALKDIMDHAVKNGYDAVTFNNGELAKTYAAGGGGDIKGLKDWYERQIPARMQKLFGLKNEPVSMYDNNEENMEPQYNSVGYPQYNSVGYKDRTGHAVNHTVPFFRLRHNGKLLGNLEKSKKSGMFLMSNQIRK